MKKLSFRMQVLLPVLAAVVVAFVFVGVLVYTSFKKEVTSVTQDYAWSFARNVAKDIDMRFARVTDVVDGMSNTATILNTFGRDEETIFSYLEGMARADASILAFYIIWADDNYAPQVLSVNGNLSRMFIPSDQLEGEWYQTPLSTGRHYITPESTTDDYDGTEYTTITVTKPFYVNGKLMGIVGVDIFINDLMEQVSAVKVYDTGYAVLLSPMQTYLTHQNEIMIEQKVDLTPDESAKFNSHAEFTKSVASLSTGKMVDVFFTPIVLSRTATFYYIGLMVPQDEMLAAVNQARLLIMAIAIGATLVVSLVVFLVVRGLMSMVGGEPSHVISSVNKIADGDFSIAILHNNKDNRSLVFYINSMVAKLRQIVSDSTDVADRLREASAELSSGANELSAGMTTQADQTEQISSAATEMSTTTADIARNIDDIVGVTNEAESKVAESISTVEGSLSEIHKIKSTADEASELIKGLEEKSSEI